MKNIFVYGSLKRGNALHSVLEKSDFLSEAITLEPIFKMFCNGAFPYVSNVGKGGYRIIGELYNVSEMTVQELDLIEGHPTHYRRTDTEFMLEGGNVVVGQMYIFNGSVKNLKEITSGCWFTPTNVKLKEKLENKTKKV